MTMKNLTCAALSTALLTFANAASALENIQLYGPAAHNVNHNSYSSLDRHNHYTNKDGIIVHSPAKTLYGSVPKNASAKCRDRTYSFSLNRSGTCSRHGGVLSW